MLVVLGRVLAVGALLCNDRRPDPYSVLAFLDVTIELSSPRVVPSDLRRVRTLERDQERVPMGVVVEFRLDSLTTPGIVDSLLPRQSRQ